MSNKTIMQYFEWYLPVDGRHWQRTARDAAHLARLGITDLWLPPAYKGHVGMTDVGYGVYDLYDLGEFYQKGTIPTKYGTKDEYIAAIDALHAHGIRVVADIVLNHRMGEDGWDKVVGSKMDPKNRLVALLRSREYAVPTRYDFPGRNGVYSSFRWNYTHFCASDRADRQKKDGIVKYTPAWSQEVDKENENYQYLMGADVNFDNPEVVHELIRWGSWYLETCGIDGVRLDAVKHIPYSFYPKWLETLRGHLGRNFFAVGEYWQGNAATLEQYLNNCGRCMSLFDVALHYRFANLSHKLDDPHAKTEDKDLRKVFDDTLLSRAPDHAVTFVDNHDTQPGQALESWVAEWFKPLAYALILLRDKGTPCVFYGDLYGIPHDDIAPVPGLEKLLQARKDFGSCSQFEDFSRNDWCRMGWTRGGTMAVVMSTEGEQKMYLPAGKPGQRYVDLLGNHPAEVVIDKNGWGGFLASHRSVSVWVPKEYAQQQ